MLLILTPSPIGKKFFFKVEESAIEYVAKDKGSLTTWNDIGKIGCEDPSFETSPGKDQGSNFCENLCLSDVITMEYVTACHVLLVDKSVNLGFFLVELKYWKILFVRANHHIFLPITKESVEQLRKLWKKCFGTDLTISQQFFSLNSHFVKIWFNFDLQRNVGVISTLYWYF